MAQAAKSHHPLQSGGCNTWGHASHPTGRLDHIHPQEGQPITPSQEELISVTLLKDRRAFHKSQVAWDRTQKLSAFLYDKNEAQAWVDAYRVL